MPVSQPRKPKGTPVGGQFDRYAGGEISASLAPAPLNYQDGEFWHDAKMVAPNDAKPGDSEFNYTTPNWWPTEVGDSSDLPDFPGESWEHSLFGDTSGNGGGHLFDSVKNRKIAGKTSFPRTWGASEIGIATAKVLRTDAWKLHTQEKC